MAKRPRNFVAKELWTSKFRHKVEQPKKEKKEFDRREWEKELELEDSKLGSLESIFSIEEDWD